MYFNQPLSANQQAHVEAALNGQPQAIERFEYCDPDCAYALAQKLFAGDPTTLARLSPPSRSPCSTRSFRPTTPPSTI